MTSHPARSERAGTSLSHSPGSCSPQQSAYSRSRLDPAGGGLPFGDGTSWDSDGIAPEALSPYRGIVWVFCAAFSVGAWILVLSACGVL